MALTPSRSLRAPRQYRELAEKSRVKAAAITDDASLRRSYLDLAASYDKLADTMERLFTGEANASC